MLLDDILLPLIQEEIFGSLLIGSIWVAEPMEPVAIMGVVPVIKEKVVQECGADDGAVTDVPAKGTVQPKGQGIAFPRDHDTVAQAVCFAVLHILFHGAHQRDR